MKKSKCDALLFSAIVSILMLAQPVAAGITNGDFSLDPPGAGWTFGAENIDVSSDATAFDGNGMAVLRPDDEEEPSVSTLSQAGITLLPTDLLLSFDMTMTVTDTIGETDVFTVAFGSFTYTLASSDLTDDSYSETVTVDLAGWVPGPYTLAFDLSNVPDGIFTAVEIDNVTLGESKVVIPAPGALTLALIGIAAIAHRRR